MNRQWQLLRGKKEKDTLYQSVHTFATLQEANAYWPHALARLLDVNGWSKMDSLTANFQLYNATGTLLHRNKVQLGDFIRIELPGPPPTYWVEVTKVDIRSDIASFTVRPTQSPVKNTEDKPQETDHFFASTARSVFKLEKKERTIVAMQIGLDEKINNSPEQAAGNGLINTLVAEAGWMGFQPHQWNTITNYIVGNS